ncbi:DNA polymerase III subunit delta' [Shimia ponticola]|uniref:DNA polymerase III subunit delta' n=1 Tax=Shimia ponticola TaxID=2582893 RepID=UPI0011BFB1AB|nr:DNA polymerase III subunit delta' [Shimia ponticola]
MSDLPEPDKLPDAPHPRDTLDLFGHDAAQANFLDAFITGRLHHAWMITGPKGIGKATLAWRIARFLRANPEAENDGLFGAPPAPTNLVVDPDHPTARRMAAGSEAGLYVLRRSPNEKGDRLSGEIRVSDVRKLKAFFSLSVADGGRRVVIVDAADEMNTNAANALLKVLEEPPANTTLLLIAHQPSALLPTIRSRCRVLRCDPLGPDDMTAALRQAGIATEQPQALSALSGGSVGTAIRLETQDGVALYSALVSILGQVPNIDRQLALKLADTVTARTPERMTLILDLFDLVLARLARTGVMGVPTPSATEQEAEVFARLCPNAATARHWASVSQSLVDRARRGASVNLDPPSLILDMLFQIEAEARRAI